MKIAILVAMDKELNLFLNLMPDHKEIRIGGKKYFTGKIGDKEIIAGKCGIGKVNAAINTIILINSFHPELVINTGVAGGASNRINIGDVLVSDRIAYHDVWCGPGTEYGNADGFDKYFIPSKEILKQAFKTNSDIKTGLICSGDKFIHTAEEVDEIKKHFPDVLAVDMESAAIAQSCEVSNVPFVVIRVMSDTPGEGDNVEQYKNFWSEAPEKTFNCVESLIKSL